MKICITNVATGDVYKEGQERLKESIETFTNHDMLFFTDQFPPESPTHNECPYGFKMYAINEAYKKGYDMIAWADSSCVLLDDFPEAIKIAESKGIFTNKTGFKVGYWCTDACLESFNITREQAFNIPLLDQGGFVIYNMKHNFTKKVVKEMMERTKDGISFQGPWRKEDGFVSKDPSVLGHRHDMSVFSLLMNKYGFLPSTHRIHYVAHNESWRADKIKGIIQNKDNRFSILWAPGVLSFKDVIKEIGPTWFDANKFKEIVGK